MQHCGIEYHIYADDTQLYCSFDISSPHEALCTIHNCISDIRSWIIANKLKSSDDETKFLVVTSPKVNLSANF